MRRLATAILILLLWSSPVFAKTVILPLGGGATTLGASQTVADDFWMGLSVSTCRLVFNDTTADELHVLDCLVQVGAASGAGLVNITPQSAIAGLDIDMAANDENAIAINTEAAGYYAIAITAKYGIDILQDVSGGRGFQVRRAIDEAGSNELVKISDQHANNEQSSFVVDHDGTGGASGHSVDIDHENTAAAAVKIDTPTGSPVWELIATSDTPDASPETNAEDGWIEIDIGGTPFYIPYYRLTQ